jgi:hypothetical protein
VRCSEGVVLVLVGHKSVCIGCKTLAVSLMEIDGF